MKFVAGCILFVAVCVVIGIVVTFPIQTLALVAVGWVFVKVVNS